MDAFQNRNSDSFESFLEIVNSNPDLANYDFKDPELVKIRHLKMIWLRFHDEKSEKIFKVFRYNFRVFEDHSFYSFCLKVFGLIDGLRLLSFNQHFYRNNSIDCLSELMITKSKAIHHFCILFNDSSVSEFVDSLFYFYKSSESYVIPNRLSIENHVVFIQKTISFIENQIHYFRELQLKEGNESKRLAIIIMRKIMMPNVILSSNEVEELLRVIIGKIFDNSQLLENPTKIMKFYVALFYNILGNTSVELGNYFQEQHKEKFMKTLIMCMNTESKLKRINYLFHDTLQRDMKQTNMFLYLYFFITGVLKRNEFDEKEPIEQDFCELYNMEQEFFDFLETYINRTDEKFDQMLMNVHKKFIQNGGEPLSFLKEELDWPILYQTVLTLLSDQTPNLNFVSNIMKIPLNKLNFIVILNNLKVREKSAKALEEAESSNSFKGLLEQLKLDYDEVINFCKLCVNIVDYDSINQLVKSLKLDSTLDSDVLISLLMMSLPLESKPE